MSGRKLTMVSSALLCAVVVAQVLLAAPQSIQRLPRRPVAVQTPEIPTTLKVCAHGAGCPPGVAGWLDEAVTVPPDARALPREFTWKTNAPGVTGARWQVSTSPFAGGADDLRGVVSAGEAGSPQAGRFTITFTDLPPLQQGRVRRVIPPGIRAFPPRYYVRVIPMIGDKPANTISNTVRLDFPQAAPSQANPIVVQSDDAYTVSIVGFQTIKPQTMPWGCVIITAVDKSAFTQMEAALLSIYEQSAASGKPMCPKTYKGMGQKPWYESLWDFTSTGVSWLSEAYAGLKQLAVQTIVSAINVLPGNLCNATCEKGLTMGLNAALVALGVPPNLPTLDQLTNQGMNYLVSVAASQAGIDCGPDCQDVIRSGIQTMAKQAMQTTVSSYCGDVELAHRNGAEPLCLHAGVTAVPAPGSSSQPARITVRVTRKDAARAYSALAADRLTIRFAATNATAVGQTFQVATNTCTTDTSVFPCDLKMIKIDQPLQGALFSAVRPELPRMKPGQTIEYPFFLSPAPYWLPGHQALIAAAGGRVQYDDWWKLYQGAELKISVDVECPQTTGSPMASCVSQPAVMSTQLPGRSR